jgi:hypothetical protein
VRYADVNPLRRRLSPRPLQAANRPVDLMDIGSSHELQGGPFSAEEAASLIGRVRLRRWDEPAKVPRKTTPDLEHFRRHLDEVHRSGA